MFVSTNGAITFGEPRPCDNDGNSSDFATADKIAVAHFDLEVRSGTEILVNATDPEQVVVTWNEVALCGLAGTSNTFQAVLFPDGRIRMNYGYLSTRGLGTGCLASSVSGSIVGIAPRSPSQVLSRTFSVDAVEIGPTDAVFNQFFLDRLFDLENEALLFIPLGEGGVFSGYRVELPATGAESGRR